MQSGMMCPANTAMVKSSIEIFSAEFFAEDLLSSSQATEPLVMTSSAKRSPRLSIGIPVYNGENFLAQTLDSLLAQTFRDFEIVISDNASTDRTPEICRAYARCDPRVRYVRNHE